MNVAALTNRKLLTFWAALALLVAVLTWGLFRFVSPAPPRTLTMSTGVA